MARKLLTVSLRAIDVDQRLGGEAGIDVEDSRPLSTSFAEAVYWLILLLFLPAALAALGVEGLLGPVEQLVGEILGVVPNLFAAALILAIGWFGARLRQMGLAEDIINLAFGLLLGSIAVATALAFGLGSREIAARHVERWVAALNDADAGRGPSAR